MMKGSTEKTNVCLAWIDGDEYELQWFLRGTYDQISHVCAQFNQPMVDLFVESARQQRDLWIQKISSFRDFSLDDMKQSK